jgi:hypothetical protein
MIWLRGIDQRSLDAREAIVKWAARPMCGCKSTSVPGAETLGTPGASTGRREEDSLLRSTCPDHMRFVGAGWSPAQRSRALLYGETSCLSVVARGRFPSARPRALAKRTIQTAPEAKTELAAPYPEARRGGTFGRAECRAPLGGLQRATFRDLWAGRGQRIAERNLPGADNELPRTRAERSSLRRARYPARGRPDYAPGSSR